MVEARRCQEWAHPSAQPSVPTLGNRAQGHWTLGSWAAGAAAGKPAHRRAAATAQARPSAAEASPGTPGRLPRTKAALRPEVGPEKATGLAMQAARRTARVEAEGSADRDVPACQRRSVPRRPSPPAPAAVRPTVRRVPGLAAVQTTVRRDAATAARARPADPLLRADRSLRAGHSRQALRTAARVPAQAGRLRQVRRTADRRAPVGAGRTAVVRSVAVRSAAAGPAAIAQRPDRTAAAPAQDPDRSRVGRQDSDHMVVEAADLGLGSGHTVTEGADLGLGSARRAAEAAVPGLGCGQTVAEAAVPGLSSGQTAAEAADLEPDSARMAAGAADLAQHPDHMEADPELGSGRMVAVLARDLDRYPAARQGSDRTEADPRAGGRADCWSLDHWS